jgi:hypothetical protein
MTSKKLNDTEKRKLKHYIVLCGEFALNEAVDLQYDRLQNEKIFTL